MWDPLLRIKTNYKKCKKKEWCYANYDGRAKKGKNLNDYFK